MKEIPNSRLQWPTKANGSAASQEVMSLLRHSWQPKIEISGSNRNRIRHAHLFMTASLVAVHVCHYSAYPSAQSAYTVNLKRLLSKNLETEPLRSRD